jgi:nucleotide-binding universal stress UspA family protein
MLPVMNALDGPIVIGFDGSAAARQAVADAAKLLPSRRTVIVTVWEPGLAYTSIAGAPDVTMPPAVDPSAVLDLDRELGARAEGVANQGAELARSLGLEAEAVAVPDAGGVARTILVVAGEREAAAVVVGSRGLSGLKARLEGSTSNSVVKRASCPVIVVHEAAPDPDE